MTYSLADPVTRVRSALDGRYVVERELARGGMATVYLAEDPRHHRKVAIKVLRQELAATVGAARFLREIAVAAELQHPNILPLLDSGEADGLLYYVMPYVDGDSLRMRLDRMRQLPIDEALRITCEVADALDYAHRHGVVHRDVKPENVLLEDCHAVIADFGIARALGGIGPDTPVATLTATGIAVGTPAYMSPEQAAGGHDMDGRSDVYSLGCLLYELLAGQPPFHGPTAESVVRQHITAPPPSVRILRPTAPAYVEAAVERALAKAPADRFQTAAELREALRQGDAEGRGNSARAGHNAALAPADQSGRATGAATRRPMPGRRALALVLGVAVLAATGVWMLNRQPAVRAVARAPTPAAAPATPRWVLVADFDGPPDDPTLAIAVRELVTAVLGESKTLAMVPRDHLQSARRAALLPDTAADQSLQRAESLFDAEHGNVAGIERTRLLLAVVGNRSPGARARIPKGDTTHAWLFSRSIRDALVGDTVAATRAILTVRVPESSVVLHDVALVRAIIAARYDRWPNVVQLLGSAAWQGVPGIPESGSLAMRRWLVGEAYERMGRPDSAAAYFELLVTAVRAGWDEQLPRGIAYPFAHRRLALLYTRLNRPEKARHHWQTFLGTFTEPDPEYRPLVEEAKRQLELLR